MNSSSTGEASDILLMRKPGPQKPLHGMFLQLIEKPTYIAGSIFRKVGGSPGRRNGLPTNSSSSSRCRDHHEE